MGRGRGNLSLSACSKQDFGVLCILSCPTVPVYGDFLPSLGLEVGVSVARQLLEAQDPGGVSGHQACPGTSWPLMG